MTKATFPQARCHRAHYQPRLELLEDRCVPAATITVNTTADANVRDSVLSLREAILIGNRTLAVAGLTATEQAQVSGTPTDMDTDTIAFNIGAGTPLIPITVALPTITDPVIMDGATGGATRVHIRGPGFNPLFSVATGLHITAGASTINRMVISNLLSNVVGAAILLETAGGNTITGCFLGTDATGAIGENARVGLHVNNVPDNTIGGTTAGAGNVISGNENGNIRITGDNATGNVIQGNFIGTNASGTARIGGPGAQRGILVIAADNNTVGGTSPGARNVISGLDGPGIELMAATVNGVGASGNRIEGNYIGTDVTGTSRIGNAAGIDITDSPGNVIGGAAPGAGNVISGAVSAIRILRFGASGNTIQGNLIGTDATGTVPLGNLGSAIVINNAPSTLIGGAVAGAGNVISASVNGIDISGGGGGGPNNGNNAIGTVIQGNYIGTDITGMVDLGNTQWGITNSGGVRTQIGGRTALARNVISGNNDAGISNRPAPDPAGDVIEGNYIGVAADGVTALGNSGINGIGIALEGTGTTLVGGTADGAGNVISGNTRYGIYVISSGNLIQGNRIGVAADGTTALGNGLDGITIVSNNTVGGTAVGAANTIAFNGGDGVSVLGTVTILSNSIFDNTGRGISGSAAPAPTLTANTASTISGTLAGAASTTYRLEFFATPNTGPTAGDQGKTFLGFLDVPTGGTGSASFTFTAAGGVPAGQFLTATATSPTGFTSNFSDAFTAPGSPAADLAVTKTGSPDPVTLGQNVTYTVTVFNNGPAAATNVALMDTLPTGVTFVSATGGVVPVGSVLTFDLGTLANQQSASVTIVVRPEAMGQITNTASATADTGDPDASNNTGITATTAVLDPPVRDAAPVAPLAAPSAVPPPDELAGGLAGGSLLVPGQRGQQVRVEFRLVSRDAAFRNELGLIVADAAGRVKGIALTGGRSFLTALGKRGRHRVLFRQGSAPGARRELTFQAGDRLFFFLTQNSTVAQLLAQNPANRWGESPLAFFSQLQANPDGKHHLRAQHLGRRGFLLSWEDLLDNDFNDDRVRVRILK